MKKITEKQKKILEYIEFYIRVKGYPPSMREIKEYFNLKSVSTIYSHLKSLEKKGFIEISGKFRGIKVLNQKDFGIIKVDGEYIEQKINLYDAPIYIKSISGIKLISTSEYKNIIVKDDMNNYPKNTLLIFNEKNVIIGIINLKEVMIDENSYWF
ncbi:LexA family protein [Marinitoga aeolica]|uniref:HTH domain-containing protein n=1 Tax=Marinitoga aeolica TaxID=2809031 RepID=A0ABY8PRL3_9BACT|nr:HTH domain-containing protein [Marinitoga aeolica]WGS65261.1 HTH domain-containing protein [Marinitoga aeolica]